MENNDHKEEKSQLSRLNSTIVDISFTLILMLVFVWIMAMAIGLTLTFGNYESEYSRIGQAMSAGGVVFFIAALFLGNSMYNE